MSMDNCSRRIILSALLVIMLAIGDSCARELRGMPLNLVEDVPNDLQEHHNHDSRRIHNKYEHPHDDALQKNAHDHSQMDHMEAADNIFFTLSDLKIGKTIPIYFSHKDPANSPHLLSREEANSIPFSFAQLPYLLEFFSFSEESPQAKAMEYTLRTCEAKPLRGETKVCATSLESMLDFARATFGQDTGLKVLSTNHPTKFTTGINNYTISEDPKEILSQKKIGCHVMPYPYVVYYCHSQESGNRLFEIPLRGENGEEVQAAGICHMDTSQWRPDSKAFRVMKIKPGTAPVCHFFPTDNLVWVPLTA
ncbi:hypothetical protein Tsubulata_007063 [Turnera subulata]|uniref:BURP domain-containing protein n=1 Tax=Turnera subulata TaxID=218843 RepID=A0A9Q0GII0_9ROSI|nr:hypothetical protein Tsubulata_007063 [Turnera subulata]